jgi:hypothetical protein
MTDRNTNLKLSSQDAATWREIAATYEIYMTRGLGTHEVGNAAEAIRRIVRAYRRDPASTLHALQPLLERDTPGD